MSYSSTSWTTDGLTQAGSSGTTTMGGITLYAYFGAGHGMTHSFSVNTHVALPFMGYPQSTSLTDEPELGTSTDPATSLTTADDAHQMAAMFAPCMWYVPDNITIDAIYSIEGADDATGDTTRMHLMSYTFTSGSTSCLTSGTLLGHNDDVTNAGNEQVYLSTWTVDSASVAAGKVILATFRSDSVYSDYSLNVIVKYHLS